MLAKVTTTQLSTLSAELLKHYTATRHKLEPEERDQLLEIIETVQDHWETALDPNFKPRVRGRA